MRQLRPCFHGEREDKCQGKGLDAHHLERKWRPAQLNYCFDWPFEVEKILARCLRKRVKVVVRSLRSTENSVKSHVGCRGASRDFRRSEFKVVCGFDGSRRRRRGDCPIHTYL